MGQQFIYSPKVIELITVCTEYCRYLEQCQGKQQEEFADVMRGLLSLIYLKVSLLGDVPEEQGYNQGRVTEDDYNYIQGSVAAIMGIDDDYLDTFVVDFKYSDRPIRCTISENLADVYQTLRNLVEIFREGNEEAMQVALYEAVEEFKLTWGQSLLNALRALHDVRFGAPKNLSE